MLFEGAQALKDHVGKEVGVSDWVEVTQHDIDAFASVTRDAQWIHVDVGRAAASDWGGTIAHGLYTLSLGPQFMYSLMEVHGFEFSLNYGFERVRFPAPLPVGSKVRMRAALMSADDVDGGVQLVVRQTFEAAGQAKPVCVADSVSRWVN